jgi:hypothetical protein
VTALEPSRGIAAMEHLLRVDVVNVLNDRFLRCRQELLASDWPLLEKSNMVSCASYLCVDFTSKHNHLHAHTQQPHSKARDNVRSPAGFCTGK